jgi:hypothetical protein
MRHMSAPFGYFLSPPKPQHLSDVSLCTVCGAQGSRHIQREASDGELQEEISTRDLGYSFCAAYIVCCMFCMPETIMLAIKLVRLTLVARRSR